MPESVRRDIKDILDSPYERGDRVTVPVGVAEDAKPFVGNNFKATLRDLEERMRKAASDLEFETAARLRDEIKRLEMAELGVQEAAEIAAGTRGRSMKDVSIRKPSRHGTSRCPPRGN